MLWGFFSIIPSNPVGEVLIVPVLPVKTLPAVTPLTGSRARVKLWLSESRVPTVQSPISHLVQDGASSNLWRSNQGVSRLSSTWEVHKVLSRASWVQVKSIATVGTRARGRAPARQVRVWVYQNKYQRSVLPLLGFMNTGPLISAASVSHP